MEKKAISPLIGIILIILILSILTSIYFLWLRDATTEMMSESENIADNRIECHSMKLIINSCTIYKENNNIDSFSITLDNRSNFDLNIKIDFIGTDINEENITSSGNFTEPIKKGFIKQYTTNENFEYVSNNNLGHINNINNVIVVTKECPDKIIVLDDCVENT